MIKPQRSEEEIMALLLSFADDPRIRVATLEGSRTNPNVPKDALRDYDVSYFVEDKDAFTAQTDWLGHFGTILMMQMPESMELFPPTGPFESYLMTCDDLTKIDLGIYALSDLDRYLAESDGLCEVLVDKDHRIAEPLVGTDAAYHLRRPTLGEYTDCQNEFWHVATYVVKGLCRDELLFAADHMNGIMRKEYLRMLSWEVGEAHGYGFSVGKNVKFIPQYIEPALYQRLMGTFSMAGYAPMKQSFWELCQLMRESATRLGELLGYPYPPFDEAVTSISEAMFQVHRPE